MGKSILTQRTIGLLGEMMLSVFGTGGTLLVVPESVVGISEQRKMNPWTSKMNNQRILIAVVANATSLAGWVVLLVWGQSVKGDLGWMFLLGAAILLVLWLASIYVLRALLWQIVLHGVQDDVLHTSLSRRFRSFVIERRVAFSAFVIFTLALGILSSGFLQAIYLILVPVLVFSALLLEVILPFDKVPKNGPSR